MAVIEKFKSYVNLRCNQLLVIRIRPYVHFIVFGVICPVVFQEFLNTAIYSLTMHFWPAHIVNFDDIYRNLMYKSNVIISKFMS